MRVQCAAVAASLSLTALAVASPRETGRGTGVGPD